MTNLEAIEIIEGNQEAVTEEQSVAAWQHLVNTHIVWQLQGFYGRTAYHLIQAGIITTPDEEVAPL